MGRWRSNLVRALLAGVLLAGGGCASKGRISAENDRLRRENREQKDRITALEGEIAELKVKLAERYRPEAHLTPDHLEALPRVTKIEIGRLSGLLPTRGDEATSGVIYLVPLDGRGRFTQFTGGVVAEVLVLPRVAGGDEPQPRRVARRSYTPAELRDAYRSGLTGTHYTLELPFETPLVRPAGETLSVVLRVEAEDGLTGQRHVAERFVDRR